MSFRPFLTLFAITCVAACTRSASVQSPKPESSVSYLVRLGADTVAIENYRRAGNHIEADLMQHLPLTYVAHSVIDLAPSGLANRWSYDPRLVNGKPVGGNPRRSVLFETDSITVLSDAGAQVRRRLAGGPAVPTVANSMLSWEMAIAYAKNCGGDSVNVPTVGPSGNPGSLPIRFVTKDSVRSYYFGPNWPVYISLDADGHIARFNGLATTVKVVAIRIPEIDVRTIATRFTVRDESAGAMGMPSTRDTARAQIAGSHLSIDYGRPALRGRNPWMNGVLGDSLWRTGANEATQFKTDVDLLFGGEIIPAGMYSLWTHVFPGNSRYELVFNRQIGQWGTVHDPKLDLYRVPLAVKTIATPVERFTIVIDPNNGGGVVAMEWGRTRLEAPFAVGKK